MKIINRLPSWRPRLVWLWLRPWQRLLSLLFRWWRRIYGGGCAGYVVVVAQDIWWLEELEVKQALQFSFGLGLCKKCS
jgi:hypothetical protein